MQWHKAAINLINQGDFKTAISVCQQIIQQQPHQVQAYLIWGQALQQQGKFQAAIQCYIDALTFQPDNSQIYLELGNIYQQQHQWKDAISSYQVVIRLQPNCITAYRNSGHLLIQLKDWQAAVDVYRRLIQLSPEVSWYYNHLGKALMKLKRWKKAIDAYEESIKLNPHFCWSHYHLSQCFIQLEQWHKAEDSLNQCLYFDHQNEIFYKDLANVLKQQNKIDQLISIYHNLIEINPCSQYYINLAQIFIKQQQLETAVELLIQALNFKPNSYPVFVLLADILKQQGFIFESLQCQCLIKLPEFWIQQYINIPNHAITNTDSHLDIQRHLIYPESQIQFEPPKTLDNKTPDGFNTQQINLNSIWITTLNHGRIWSDSLTNAVINSNQQILSDLSDGCPELILASKQLPNPINIEGSVAFLSVQFGLVYYHWMLDLVPQISLLSKQNFIEKIDYFIVNRYQTDYEKTTLKLLGISQNKIIESIQSPHIQASQMIIPSRNREAVKPQQWAVDYLREQFLQNFQSSLDQSTRIYISRNQTKKRKMINEETLMNFLKKHEFKIIYFESMSVLEQANCMAAAQIVIAPHGSGLTNLVFCQPHTKIIEILSPNWLNSCYWMLSQTCQLDYFCLVGEALTESSSEFTQYQDYYVNIQKLQQLMQLAQVI